MKKDTLHSITNWIDHNRYTVVSVLVFMVTLGVVVSLTGCESTTGALAATTEDAAAVQVTRSEFEHQTLVGEKDFTIRRIQLDGMVAIFNEEVAAFNARVQVGLEDLLKKDLFKQQLLETLGGVAVSATEGTLNPTALLPIAIGLLGGALGLGTSADNRRKDKVITTLKIDQLSAAG
jgi:hypothetical protein